MTYKLHWLATAFPPMDGEEYASLKASIAENGVREPFVITDGELLVDGRHRQNAVRELADEGVIVSVPEPRVIAESEAQEYALNANLNRRHLRKGQKAMVAVRVYPQAKLGDNQHSEGSQKLRTLKDRDEMAKIAGVGVRYIDKARAVAKMPEIIGDKVIEGDKQGISLDYAYELRHFDADLLRKACEEWEDSGFRGRIADITDTLQGARDVRRAERKRRQAEEAEAAEREARRVAEREARRAEARERAEREAEEAARRAEEEAIEARHKSEREARQAREAARRAEAEAEAARERADREAAEAAEQAAREAAEKAEREAAEAREAADKAERERREAEAREAAERERRERLEAEAEAAREQERLERERREQAARELAEARRRQAEETADREAREAREIGDKIAEIARFVNHDEFDTLIALIRKANKAALEAAREYHAEIGEIDSGAGVALGKLGE